MNRVIGRMSGIIISLVLIFKSQLTALVGTIFGKITQSALSV